MNGALRALRQSKRGITAPAPHERSQAMGAAPRQLRPGEIRLKPNRRHNKLFPATPP